MDRLHLINVFVAVAETKGFASAARKLSISPPAVTRAINELEIHLGVSLVKRTTRVVRLTEHGMRFVEDCRLILDQLAEADGAVRGLHRAPTGHLTITAPRLFGALHVTPIVTEYLERYTNASASCWFFDRVVDLLAEGADIGIRIGDLPALPRQAILVAEVRRVVCAAPSYFEQHGAPKTPGDLRGHVVVSARTGYLAEGWRFLEHGAPSVIKLRPRLITSGNDVAVAAALLGFGITNVWSYQVETHLREGRLTAALEDYTPPPFPVHVVHRDDLHTSKSARAFIDLTVERLRKQFDSRKQSG